MNPLWTLAPVSVLCGAAIAWIFGRVANGAALRATVNRIQAHLLEFWLYVDEPRAIWKSWKGLLTANARLLRLLLPPLVMLAIPSLPLYFFLDVIYGTSPLPVGKPALVTLALDVPDSQVPDLLVPDGILVESGAVRVASLREVSWRIRPLRAVSGELRWTGGGTKRSASVIAGDSYWYHWRSRSSISYPPATLEFFGWQCHWSVWFVVLSLSGALIVSARRT